MSASRWDGPRCFGLTLNIGQKSERLSPNCLYERGSK
jgi:hypothetical protein